MTNHATQVERRAIGKAIEVARTYFGIPEYIIKLPFKTNSVATFDDILE